MYIWCIYFRYVCTWYIWVCDYLLVWLSVNIHTCAHINICEYRYAVRCVNEFALAFLYEWVCMCVYLLCWWPESCCRLFKLICVNRDSGMEGRGQYIICLSAASPLWSESSGHVPSPCGPLQIRTGQLSSAFWGKSLHPCTRSPLRSPLSWVSPRLSVHPLLFTSERQVWPLCHLHPSITPPILSSV